MIKNLKVSNWFKKKKLKDINYFRSLVENGHGYSMLKNSIHPCEMGETNYEIAMKVDNVGYMPEDVGYLLDQIVNDPNSEYVLGVHCTRSPNEGMVDKIFSEGLINNGHLSTGGAAGFTSISSTVEIFRPLNNELRRAIQYIKGGRYGYGDRIIFKIPKSYLGIAQGEVKPIFYKYNGIVRILPEFILGSLTVDQNQVVSNFKFNPNYKDTHENLPTGFKIKMDPVYFANGKIGTYRPTLDEYYKNIEDSELYYDSQIDPINKLGKIVQVYKLTEVEKGEEYALMTLINFIDKGDISMFSNKQILENEDFNNTRAFMAYQLGIKPVHDIELNKMSIEEAQKIKNDNNKEIIDAFMNLAYKSLNIEQSKNL